MYSILASGIGHAGASFSSVFISQGLVGMVCKDYITNNLSKYNLQEKDKTKVIMGATQVIASIAAISGSKLVENLLNESEYHIGSKTWGISGTNLYILGAQASYIAYNMVVEPTVNFLTGKALEIMGGKSGVGKDFADYAERAKFLFFDVNATQDDLEKTKKDFIEKHGETSHFVMRSTRIAALALTLLAANVAVAYGISSN